MFTLTTFTLTFNKERKTFIPLMLTNIDLS